jgi:hypothetical protein
MSIIFMESFDHYTTEAQAINKGWTNLDSISSTYKRTGGQSGVAGSTSARLTLPVAIANNTAIFATFAFYQPITNVTSFSLLEVPNNETVTDCSVYVYSTGAIGVGHGGYASYTELAVTAPGVFKFGVWNHFEVKVIVHNSTGAMTVKLNGNQILSVTNQDTRHGTGNTSTTELEWGHGCTNGCLDDVVVSYNDSDGVNDDFLGDCRVVCLLPQTDAVAAGSNADFTCSTGTDHGALVDEATPNDDTDYVYSSTLNHVDSWEFPALGYTGTVKGVQVSLRGKKSDTGTRAIAAVTKPDATNRVHATNHYLATDYAYYNAVWNQNPEDSAAWEVTDIDGAEFGVKVTV